MTISMPSSVVGRVLEIVRRKEPMTRYGPIGADFADDGLRLVQFRKFADRLELHASVHVSMTEEQCESSSQLRALMKKTLKEYGFAGREVVSSLPPDKVKILMLSFMQQADKNDEELIVQRIADRIDDSIENYVIDYMMVRPDIEHGQERSVLVALASQEEVVSHLEHLRHAGLTVNFLEIEPTALRRLIAVKHDGDYSSNLMTISLGCSQTYITVLSGRRLIYERNVDFGELQLVETLCNELEVEEHEARAMLVRGENITAYVPADEQDVSVTEALYSVIKPLFMELVEEINRALIYAASETRGKPVKHVYLTNQVATWQGIDNFISTLIEVPVSVLMPFEGFDKAGESIVDPGPRAAVVTGMALHGLTGPG